MSRQRSRASETSDLAKASLTAQALLEIVIPHSPAVSPDGSQVAFCVTSADFGESRWIPRLWLADIPEGNARQICFSDAGEASPAYSPDGKWLAFLSARTDLSQPPPSDDDYDEDPRDQVWVLPLHGGEAFCLTHAGEGVAVFRWSPDSQSIFFLTLQDRAPSLKHAFQEKKRRRHDSVFLHGDKRRVDLWHVTLEERQAELVNPGDPGLIDFDLAPDGKRAVLVSNFTGEPNDYHRLDLSLLDMETGASTELTFRAGPKVRPRFSPDGNHLAFLGPLDPEVTFSQEGLFSLDLISRQLTNVTENSTVDVQAFDWASDGSLWFTAADRTFGPAFRYANGCVEAVDHTRGWLCEGISSAPPGGFVTCAERPGEPPELYWVDAKGNEHRLTELNSGWSNRYRLPKQETVHWQNDGQDLEGILTHPRIASRIAPVILLLHGGPKARSTTSLLSYDMPALLAAEGYVVFEPNFRGSEGYGNAFALASRGDLGGADLQDCLSGLDEVIRCTGADPSRIAVMGASYGGYLSLMAIGKTDRFKAAVSKCGIFDLATDFGGSELWRWEREYLGGYLWEQRDRYRDSSPMTNAEAIHTPLLLIHGEGDDTTPFINSRQAYNSLKALGRTVKLMRFPREGHGVSEPGHRIEEARAVLEFLRTHLLGQVAALSDHGDIVLHNGLHLSILSVKEADPAVQGRRDERLIEVDIALASEGPVEQDWQLRVDSMLIRTSDGRSHAPVGVVIDTPGGKTLLAGRSLTLDLCPRTEDGIINLAVTLAYTAQPWGGIAELRIADLPPLRITIPPEERDSDETRKLRQAP